MSTCLSCVNWAPKKSGAMAKQRLALCELGSIWCYLPPTHTCKSHKRADATTVKAREEWLAKERKC